MNTLGLGRPVETLGLGVPYGGAITVIVGEVINFALRISKLITFFLR